MDIPSLFMIPSAVSSGKVHSVFPNSTDADFDFNRDSDATRVNSQGLIERVGYYGSELVTNGGFDTNTNWGFIGTANISNGFAVFPDTTSSYIFQTNIVDLSVKKYKLIYEVIETNAGTLRLSGGNSAFGTVDLNSSVGVHTIDLTSNGTKRHLQFFNATSFVGKIDNVSLKEVTGDRARLNYEIEGGLVNTKPSLLLEPQSTNLIEYSQDFTTRGGKWQTFGTVTKELNTVISPEGIRNAATIKGLDGAGTNDFRYAFSFNTANKTVTYSVYLKGSGTVRLQISNGVDQAHNNTVTLSNEWQRFSVTGTFNSTSVSTVYLVIDDYLSLTATEYDVWGAQFEELGYATSYIPTNGSTQTRAAETCNGAGTSSILPSEEGILYVEAKALVDGGTSREITLTSGASTNIIRLRYGSDVSRFLAFMRSGGGTTQSLSRSAKPQDVYRKIAIEYNSTEFAMWIDGTKEATVTTTSTPIGLNKLEFELGGASFFYGKIRDIRVYNTKDMTDSEIDILLTKITS